MAECQGSFSCPNWCGGCDSLPYGGGGCLHCDEFAGCPDPLASNYNVGCAEQCLGCTDANGEIVFNSTHCCNYPTIGCTDSGATNFDPAAGQACEGAFPNSCCQYECQVDSDCSPIEYCNEGIPNRCEISNLAVGCTDPQAWNYCADCFYDLYDECDYDDTSEGFGGEGADFDFDYIVRVQDTDFNTNEISLQNSVKTSFDVIQWNNPICLVTDPLIFESTEDDFTKCDYAAMIDNSNHSHNNGGNADKIYVVEFYDYTLTAEFNSLGSNSVFTGEVSYIEPIEYSLDGLNTGGLGVINYNESNSITTFKYASLANWNGEQKVHARVRELTGDMIFKDLQNYSTPSPSIQETPDTAVRKFEFTNNLEQKFNITLWLMDAEGGYTLSIRKLGGDWVTLDIPNRPQLYHGGNYYTAPYTYTIDNSIFGTDENGNILNDSSLEGTFEIALWNHNGSGDGVAQRGIYVYNISDADYLTTYKEMNHIVLPIPDGYEYTPNEQITESYTLESGDVYKSDIDLYVNAARPNATIDFDVFSRNYCVDENDVTTSTPCDNIFLQQVDIQEVLADVPNVPVGQFIPSGESNAMTYQYFHTGPIDAKKVYMTISLRDIDSGKVSINGVEANQVLDKNLGFENNFSVGSQLSRLSTQTLSWDVEDETGNLLINQGENIIKIWDNSGGVLSSNTCDNCLRGPDGSTNGCCGSIDSTVSENCTQYWLGEGLLDYQAWDQYCVIAACSEAPTFCQEYEHAGAQLLKYTLWQEENCPEGLNCKSFGTISDVDVVPNLSGNSADAISDVHLAKCIENKLCIETGVTTGDEVPKLTKLGMIHYDYYLRFNKEHMSNILYPNERIEGALLQGAVSDYRNLRDLWLENKQREFVLQGFRDSDNSCCTPYGEYPDFDCIESLQTRFVINDMGELVGNYVKNSNLLNIEWGPEDWNNERPDCGGSEWYQEYSDVPSIVPDTMNDMYKAYNWTEGHNCFNRGLGDTVRWWAGTVNQGYHSKVIKDDVICRSDNCIEQDDRNETYQIVDPRWAIGDNGDSANIENLVWQENGTYYINNVHRWLGHRQTILSNIEDDDLWFSGDNVNLTPGQIITVSVYVKSVPNSDTEHTSAPRKKPMFGIHHEYRNPQNMDEFIKGWGNSEIEGYAIDPKTGAPYSTRTIYEAEPNTDWNIWEKREFTFEIGWDWKPTSFASLYLYGYKEQDYSILYYDSPQVNIGPTAGFGFVDDVERPESDKYYYQHFAVDANILNSPLGFCHGDKVLQNSALGFGSQAYDMVVSPQPEKLHFDIEISREIIKDGVTYPPGASPAGQQWPNGANHQNFGFLEGLFIQTKDWEYPLTNCPYSQYEIRFGDGIDWNDDSLEFEDIVDVYNCPTSVNTSEAFHKYLTTNGSIEGFGSYDDLWNEKSDNPYHFGSSDNNFLLGSIIANYEPVLMALSVGQDFNQAEDDTLVSLEQLYNERAHTIPYSVVPYDYKGRLIDDNHFLFSGFLFDHSVNLSSNQVPACVTNYTSPDTQHPNRDGLGELTGTYSTPILSGVWHQFISKYSSYWNIGLGGAGGYPPLMDGNQAVQMLFFSNFDRRIRGDFSGGGDTMIWGGQDCLDERLDYNLHSAGVFSGNCANYNDGSCKGDIIELNPNDYIPSWYRNDNSQDGLAESYDGNCNNEFSCRWSRPFLRQSNFIGPVRYHHTTKPTHNSFSGTYYYDGNRYSLGFGKYDGTDGVLDIKTTIGQTIEENEFKGGTFYHAPLPITLKHFDLIDDTNIINIQPQPIDSSSLFPATEPYRVTVSVKDDSDVLSTLWSLSNNSYPQVNDSLHDYIVKNLGLKNEDIYVQQGSGYESINYNIRLMSKPKSEHAFSKIYFDTAFDGVSRVLPFFREGLPFYVDDLNATEAVVAFDLVKYLGNSDIYENNLPINFFKTFKQNIEILDANKPKFTEISYVGEHHDQVGVQQGQLVTYNNSGNLLSPTYIENNSSGTVSVGSIEFAGYQLGNNPAVPAYIAIQDSLGNLTNISGIFTIEESQLAERIATAINTGYEGIQTHQAIVQDNLSSDTDDSIYKTVEIKSLGIGEENNTTLVWTVTTDQVQSNPKFNNLINGSRIITIDVYEDFNYIDLEIVAGDIDPTSAITFASDIENEMIISSSIQSFIQMNPFTNEGDTIYEGGDNIVNLSEGETVSVGTIRLSSYPNMTVDYTRIDNLSEEEISNPELDIPMIPLQKDYNGTLDFVIRAVDNTTMYDEVKFRLIIHPVNDPPMFEIIGDKDIYMNNENYPTNLSIPIKTTDVEENGGNITVNSVEQVTEEYCERILQEITKIEEATGLYTNPQTGEEIEIGCTDRNQCRWYCLPYNSDLECDFTDFNDDYTINGLDYEQCLEAAADTVNLTTIELSNVPYWIDADAADGNGMSYQDKLDDDTIEEYDFVNIVPEYNETGSAVFRVKATDNGYNENYEIDEIRTGFTTASINIKPLSTEGPTGDILAIPYASLGVKPDTYAYTARGDDTRSTIPTELQTNLKLDFARYHQLEDKSDVTNHSVENPYNTKLECGQLNHIDSISGILDPGFIGERGFCCSTIPVSTSQTYLENSWINKYWNDSKTYYYQDDWDDAVQDYLDFIDKINDTPEDNICSVQTVTNTREYNQNTYISSSNAGGFANPNLNLNQLDYTKNYRLEIEDLVNSYDVAELIQSSSGKNWTEEFDDFEDLGQGINEPWSQRWDAIHQEGWDTGGDRNENWGKIVFSSPSIDALDDAKTITEEGLVYRFGKPSIYLVTIFAEDSYGFVGKTEEIIDARDLVKLNQTLLHQYDPWQGLNITGSQPVKNSIIDIQQRDKDERESLGLYYYDELNYITDWHLKYGDNYRGMEGNWTFSFPIQYYKGEVLNQLQFSENFDNRYIRASLTTLYNDNDNRVIFYTIMRNAFPDFDWPTISGDLDEDTEKAINKIVNEIKADFGPSGATMFAAYAEGAIAAENLPGTIAGVVEKIEDLLTEPLTVSTEVVYSLEEESTIESEIPYVTKCIEVQQNESKTLSCPDGASIKKVIFDSYGLPTGDCGIYGINPEAHCFPNTSTWINSNSVTVQANNNLCGDTAPGVSKYRYVEVVCGFDRYDKWYKGGRDYGTDYQSNANGIEMLSEKTVAPNKTISEVDKDNVGYLYNQKDSWSDYYGRYVCDVEPDDATWLTYPFNDYDTFKISYDVESKSPYFISDSESECESECYVRLYTDLNGVDLECVQTEDASSCVNEYGDGHGGNQSKYRDCVTVDCVFLYNYTEKEAWLDTFIGGDIHGHCELEYYTNQSGGQSTRYKCCYHAYVYECPNNGLSVANKFRSTASSQCDSNCYQEYNNHPINQNAFCQELTEETVQDFHQQDKIQPYDYYVGQNNLIETSDRKRIDRIMSVYIRPWYDEQPDNNTSGVFAVPEEYKKTPSTSAINFEAVISSTPTEDNIGSSEYNTESKLSSPIYEGYYNYGYSVNLPIIWEEIQNGTSIFYNPEYHPEYEDIPLWGIEEINIDPNGTLDNTGTWYRIWVRVLHDELVTEVKTKISAAADRSGGSVYLYGASVQEIQPYDIIQNPYQKTRFVGEVGLYDFLPDVDVRSLNSADGYKSVLTEYYDDELQPRKYTETTAPLTAQLYFYIRNSLNKNLFTPKDIMKYPANSLYIGFLDWGDGSKVEYNKEPYKVSESDVLTHTYEESGIYEVTGEIFNVARDITDTILGVGTFYTFKLNLNVSINKEIEGEFNILGGEKYTFLPYQKTFPVIGGVSDSSIYKRVIKRTLGFIGEGDDKYIVNTKFKFIGDKLKSEIALATTDERYIGRTISAYTGSYPTEIGLSEEDNVIIYGGEDACEEQVSDSGSFYICPNTDESYDSRFICTENCKDFELAEFAPSGFYDGDVDVVTGELVSEGSSYTDVDGNQQISTKIPTLINKGADLYLEELGNHLGDTDLAQTRYFDRPINMWEMLGFPCFDTLEESIINYLPFNMSDWIIADVNPNSAQVMIVNDLPISLEDLFTNSYKITSGGHQLIDIYNETYIDDTFDIRGKTFTFSVYIKREQNANTEHPVTITLGTYNGFVNKFMQPGDGTGDHLISIEELEVTNSWQRLSITKTFSDDLEDFEAVGVSIVVSLGSIDEVTPYIVVGPQLEQGSMSQYRLPSQPLLAGVCTNAPGGNPNDKRYYKNTIPENYNLSLREGFEIENDILINIDEESSQDWLEGYYYPVLPKVNKFGETTEILSNNENNNVVKTPFGSIGRLWNGVEETAPITLIEINSNNNYVDDCLLDLDYGSVGDAYLEDLSGNTNIAIFIGDYKVTFNSVTNKPSKTGSFRNMVLGQKDKQKAF